MTPTLRDLAEDAFAYVTGPDVEVEERESLIFRNGRGPHALHGLVLRQRLAADDVDAAVRAARDWFRTRGRDAFVWTVADSATPGDLAKRLRAAGLEPEESDPLYAGMVLEQTPAPVPEIEVRTAVSYAEARAAAEVAWVAFGFSQEHIEAVRARHRERWELWRDAVDTDHFIAMIEGEIVGSASSAYTPVGAYLIGGSVAEPHRGRGVYRALVRARWDAAVARGTPALVVQAGRMSKPILAKLGFKQLCQIHALVDSASRAAS